MVKIVYPKGFSVEIDNGCTYAFLGDEVSIYDKSGKGIAAFRKIDGMGVIKCESENENILGEIQNYCKKHRSCYEGCKFYKFNEDEVDYCEFDESPRNWDLIGIKRELEDIEY